MGRTQFSSDVPAFDEYSLTDPIGTTSGWAEDSGVWNYDSENKTLYAPPLRSHSEVQWNTTATTGAVPYFAGPRVSIREGDSPIFPEVYLAPPSGPVQYLAVHNVTTNETVFTATPGVSTPQWYELTGLILYPGNEYHIVGGYPASAQGYRIEANDTAVDNWEMGSEPQTASATDEAFASYGGTGIGTFLGYTDSVETAVLGVRDKSNNTGSGRYIGYFRQDNGQALLEVTATDVDMVAIDPDADTLAAPNSGLQIKLEYKETDSGSWEQTSALRERVNAIQGVGPIVDARLEVFAPRLSNPTSYMALRSAMLRVKL